jgi:hypothetical protein
MTMAPPEAKEKPDTSVAEFQLFGDGLVSGQVGGVEVIQKTPTLPDLLEEAAPGAVILDVFLEMLGQVVYLFREQGHLHISGPRVALMYLEPFYNLAFFHSLAVNLIRFNRQFRFGWAGCKALFASFFCIRAGRGSEQLTISKDFICGSVGFQISMRFRLGGRLEWRQWHDETGGAN